jgi:hypothetical protein
MRTTAVAALLPLIASSGLAACEMQQGSTPTSKLPADPSTTVIGDHRAVAVEASIPDATLAEVRAMPVAMVHPEGSSPLVKGLEELAAADPARYSIRTARLPDRGWYAHGGGLGHYQAGSGNKSSARVDGFVKRIDNDHLDGAIKAAYVEDAAGDFPEGHNAEQVFTQYRATMDLNVTSAHLAGVFTEVLQAPRIITTGNASFYAGTFNYPIELPNVEVDHYSGTVAAPAGGHFGDDSVMSGNLSERDPRIAFGKYTETLAALEKEHPSVSFVYATAPLATKGNWQRNWYNWAVRSYCATNRKPLFDSAAILSHAPDGTLVQDDQRDRLAPDYVDQQAGGINQLGRERLARAWLYTLARLGGWAPTPAGETVATPANQSPEQK